MNSAQRRKFYRAVPKHGTMLITKSGMYMAYEGSVLSIRARTKSTTLCLVRLVGGGMGDEIIYCKWNTLSIL